MIPLSSPPDLLDVAGADGWLFERDRAGIAARGTATVVPASRVSEVLSSLPEGAIAIGAIDFGAREPALVVPSLVVRRHADGAGSVMTVDPSVDAVATLDALAPLPPSDPDGFTLTSPVPHDEWMDLVLKAVQEIDAGTFAKVVLAREIEVRANRTIDVPTVLRRLRSLYPACTVLSMPLASGGMFVAASPELLVSRHGSAVASHPLAGTIPRSGDPATDSALAASLLESVKDRAEHDWVVRDVQSTLEPWCTSLTVPPAPSIVSFRNVSHLGTHLTGELRAGAPGALDMALRLHPTAAVGGTPRDAALEWLRAHERLDRGPYAGPVGWVDAAGDGEFVVGIRSAVIDGTSARMFAGVGVVEGSDPAAELAETQFKLQALLAAVVRP